MINKIVEWVKDRFSYDSEARKAAQALRAEYEQEQKQEQQEFLDWDLLANRTCPNCRTKGQIGVIAEGGLAFNCKCDQCQAVYWATPLRDFGSELVHPGKPIV